MKVIIAQKGAREHYAAARALHQQGMLAGLVTDWYAFERKSGKRKAESGNSEARSQKSKVRSQQSVASGSSFVLRLLSSVVRHPSARAARCDAIPDGLVRAFPFRSLLWKWRVRRLATQGRLYEAYAQTDSAFASAVSRLKLPTHDVFFGYSYASLEMLQKEKARGKITVLCQIDPGPVHFRIVAEEMACHRELAGPPKTFPEAYFNRSRQEWALADVVVVNSEWSREAIIAEGADPAKIEILPLAYEANGEKLKSESRNAEAPHPDPLPIAPQRGEGALRVLFLGQVSPGKGIHYLIAAAKLLQNEPVQFDVVGSISILPAAVKLAPHNVRFHGPVSRDRAAEWYRQSDMFVLPTLSDGFALTQLEAMAHGLPVIATPNCGHVVVEGKTGFIIPPRDPQALADAILKFAANRSLSATMAPECRAAAEAYSVEAYGQRLVDIIQRRRPLDN